MTADELLKRMDDAFERANIVDRDSFPGSPEEAAEHDGKADAYSDCAHWVRLYFKDAGIEFLP